MSTHVCSTCHKSFVKKYNLIKHQNKKNKCINLKCNICNEIFTTKREFTRHSSKKKPCKNKTNINQNNELRKLEIDLESRKLESNEIELHKLDIELKRLELETKKLELETKKLEHNTKKLEVMADIEQEKTKRKSISNMKIMNHKSFKEFNRFSPIAQFD